MADSLELPPGFEPEVSDTSPHVPETPPGFEPDVPSPADAPAPAPFASLSDSATPTWEPIDFGGTALKPTVSPASRADAELIRSIVGGIGAPRTEAEASKHAQIQELAGKLNLPFNTVAARYDDFLAQHELAQTDPVEWLKRNPQLGEFVLRNPEAGRLVARDKKASALVRALNTITGWVFPSEADLLADVEEARAKGGEEAAKQREAINAKLETKESVRAPESTTALVKEDAKSALINDSEDPFAKFLVPYLRVKEARAGLNASRTWWEILLRRRQGKGTAQLEAIAHDFELEAQPRDYNEGPVSSFFSSAATGIDSSWQVGKEAIKTAPVGAGAGAALGALAGAAVGMLYGAPGPSAAHGARLGAVQGARLGAGAGVYLGTMRLEGGEAYKEFLRSRLDDGTPVSEETAAAGALIYGNLAAAIEVGSLGPMLRVFGPAGQMIATGSKEAAIKALLRSEPFMAAARRLGKQMAEATLAESGEEALQTMTQDAFAYWMRTAQAGKLQTAPYGVGGGINLPAAAESFAEAVPSSLLMAGGGAGFNIATHHMFADRARESAMVVNELVGFSDSPAAMANPEGFAEALRGGGLHRSLFIDAEQYQRFNQQQKADAFEHVEKLLGKDGPKQLKEALETGGRIEIPLPTYLSKLSGTEMGRVLAPFTVVSDDLPSPIAIDSKLMKERVDALLKRMEEGPLEPQSESEAKFLSVAGAQLELTTGDPKKARQQMELLRAVARVFTDAFGRDVFENIAIEISPGLDPTAEEALVARAQDVNMDRVQELLRSDSTGLPNAIAYEKTPAPAGKDMHGVLSIEGFKWLNDTLGHDKADLLARAVGVALAGHTQPFHLGGADFGFRVKDAAELKSIEAKVRDALPPQLRGFEITSAVGEDLRSARQANQEAIDLAIKEGRRANPRPVGPDKTKALPERPKGLGADLAPSAIVFPEAKASTVVSPEAVAYAQGLRPEDYFDAAYVDPVTGEWTERAWKAMRRKAHVAAFDVSGLGKLNAQFGKAAGNELLRRVGRYAQSIGGRRVDFTHLHGDEYAAQSDNPEELEGFVDELLVNLERDPLQLEDPKTGELHTIQVRVHHGFGERSYEAADRDLNARKEKLQRARAAGLVLRRDKHAGPGDSARGEAGGAGGGTKGPGRSGQEEPAGVRSGETSTAPGSGRHPLSEADQRREAALEWLSSKAGDARSPGIKKAWRALLKWAEGGMQGEVPDVPARVERAAGAAFGDVLFPDGFGFDENGRDMRRKMGGQKRVNNARDKGVGLVGNAAADAYANRKVSPMSRAFYQFPTPEESLEQMQHEMILRDVLLEAGAQVVTTPETLAEQFRRAVKVAHPHTAFVVRGQWAGVNERLFEGPEGAEEAISYIENVTKNGGSITAGYIIDTRDPGADLGSIEESNRSQLAALGLGYTGGDEIGVEVQPGILRPGEDTSAKFPRTKNLPGQAEAEKATAKGFGSMLAGWVVDPGAQRFEQSQHGNASEDLQAALDEHERELRERRGDEYLVALDENGGELFNRSSGHRDRVEITRDHINILLDYGRATLTHNHPSGRTFSVADIDLAASANLAEIRAVTPSGTVHQLKRPEGGWKALHPDQHKLRWSDDGFSGPPGLDIQAIISKLKEHRTLLQEASRRGAASASAEMDRLILAAGGELKDGRNAKGYSEEKWNEVSDRHITDAFRQLSDQQGWGWTIDVLPAEEGGAGQSSIDRRRSARVQTKGQLTLLSSGRSGAPPRGSTEVLNTGLGKLYKIVLNPGADLSTFLHESAHVFLDLMATLALRPDAPTRVRSDFAAALKYLGAKSYEDLKVKSSSPSDPARLRHEKWAEAFERYLWEGKSPSKNLESSMARFRLWMSRVYGTVSANVPGAHISDDIRQVFDRLLATDAEIEEQRKRQGATAPMAANVLGLKPEQFREHLEKWQDANGSARRRVDLAVQRDVLREKEAWWKEQLKEERSKAKDDYEALPVRQAQQALQNRGDIKTGPLDRAKVVAAIGEAAANKLGRQHVKLGGADPGPIAEFFGFKTVEEMLKALLDLKPKADWAEETAARRMAEKYPELLAEKDKLRAEVDMALHGRHDEEFLLREIAMLSKRATLPGQPLHAMQVAPAETARRAARLNVEARNVQRLDAGAALEAERRSATKALKAANEGNVRLAFAHYVDRLTNFYMWKELLGARDMRSAFLDLAGELAGDKARGRLGRASPVYRDQVDAALAELGLAEPITDITFSAEALVRQMELDTEQGRTVVVGIDAQAVDAIFAKVRQYGQGRPSGQQYQVLNVAELRQVKQMLESVQAAARAVTTVLVDGKRVELADQIEANVAAARRHLSPLPPPTEKGAATLWRSLGGAWNVFDGDQLKTETMLHWLGNGDLSSPLWRSIGKPMQDAKATETDLLNGPVKMLVEAFEKMPYAVLSRSSELIDGRALFPGHTTAVEAPQRRWQFLVMLMNMGNASNKQRLLEGRGITEQQVWDAALKLGITKEEYDYVQATLDAAEALKKPAFDLEERDTGIRPEEVVATPFMTPFGQYRGGYFPLVYHPATSIGQRQNQSLQASGYRAAGTSHGYLKSRVDDFTDIVSLAPGTIYKHIAQVAHDVAFREAIRSVALIIRNKDMRAVLVERLGQERADLLEDHLQDIGQQRGLEGSASAVAAAQVLRGMMSVSVLGYSFANVAEDLVTGVVGPMLSGALGGPVYARHMAAAVSKTLLSDSTVTELEAESGELRSRHKNLQRELLSSIARLTSRLPPMPRALLARVKDSAFVMQEFVDRRVSAAVYLAAKRKALSGIAEPTAEQKRNAIEEAEAAVRLFMPSGHVVDSAKVLRDRGVLAAMLVFFRFFSTAYNFTRGMQGRDVLSKRSAKAAGVVFGFLFAYSIVGSLARGQGKGRDEDWGTWFMRKLVTGAASQLPLFGDISESLWPMLFGGKRKDARNNSIAGMVQGILQLLMRAADGDEEADKRVRALIGAGGLMSGQPTSQFLKSAGYLADLAEGRVQARGPGDVIGGLLYGQKRDPDANIPTMLQDVVSGQEVGTGP